MRRLALLTLHVLLPDIAVAACPTAADLVQGIVLVQNAPQFRRADFEDTPRGVMEVRHERGPEGSSNTIAWYAHGLASSSEQVGGREFRTLWRGDLDALDRLDTLGEVTLTAEVLDSDGGRRDLAMRALFEGAGEYALAECRYPVWQVRYEVFLTSGEISAFRLDYAPGLGVVLAAREVGPEGEVPVFAYGWIGTSDDVRR